jgi:dUTP pyrophosphatase
LKIKLKKTNPNAIIPSYSMEGDAGMDLTAISIEIVNETNYGFIEYDTGISIEIPEGYYGDIRPRSSISKTGVILAHSPGTIDSNYRGSIKIRFKAIPNSNIYEIGDRVAQIIIKPYPKIEFEEVEELSNTQREEGGFGSTGK